jgi:hypothetical protein
MQVTTVEGYSYESVPVIMGKLPLSPELVAKSRNFLEATLAIFRPLGLRADIAPAVSARYPIHANRAEGAAKVLGVEPCDLLAANLCYDVLMGLSLMGCSTIAQPSDTGPVLTRNMDWFPAEKIAKASCLVHEDYGINAGFLGMIGSVTGLSQRGFCVCLNAVFGKTDAEGYPMLLFLRRILDTARDYREALAMAAGEHLMSGGIITLIGVRNEERAIVERTPTNCKLRSARADEPLLATNHYRALGKPEVCDRYEFMAKKAGNQPALDILTNRRVLQEITAQHVVMCPATQTAEMYVPSQLLSDEIEDHITTADLFRFIG